MGRFLYAAYSATVHPGTSTLRFMLCEPLLQKNRSLHVSPMRFSISSLLHSRDLQWSLTSGPLPLRRRSTPNDGCVSACAGHNTSASVSDFICFSPANCSSIL